MKKLVILVLLSLFMLAGCATGELSYDTGVTKDGKIVLPIATSGETYSATISGKGGTAPYTCSLYQIDTLNLDKNCKISGIAPKATETRIIPFKIDITDASGKSTTLSLSLTIKPPGLKLITIKTLGASLGEKFEFSYCVPKPGLNCGGKDTKNPIRGNPPYTFFVTGQPLGLIMNLNGVLKGTIPENARPGDYLMEVCVKDLSGDQSCGKTTFIVSSEKKIPNKWKGKYTITEKKTVDYRPHGSEYYYEYLSTQIADISFTLGGDESLNRGTVTLSAKGNCNAELTETVDVDVSARYSISADKISVHLFQSTDTPVVSLDIPCPGGPGLAEAVNPFSDTLTDYSVKPEDGAIFEETTQEGSTQVTRRLQIFVDE